MSAKSPVYIVEGARTPIGRFNGSLAGFSGSDLGGMAIKAALNRSGIPASEVDQVVMGQVLTAGEGQSAARNASIKGGIPMGVSAVTVNKVCLSGLQAINYAQMLIATGQAEVVVAGGMESMSNAPFVLPKARTGYGYGHGEVLDSLLYDGLTCAIESVLMGEGTDQYAQADSIDRQSQDEYAAQSHHRAAQAIKDGLLETEIVPVMVPQRRGDPIEFTDDEGVRPATDTAGLAKLRPAFVSDGTVTAGNASQISDGASAVVVASAAAVERLGVDPLAEVVSYSMVAGPDNCSLLHQPSNAIRAALDRASLSVDDVDLFEINEAFASQALYSVNELGIDMEKVNIHGGAIALGHPLGCTGAKLCATLMNNMQEKGAKYGIESMCIGGGMGAAALFELCD